DKSKSRFLAAASHDLRQPLQASRLYLHLLRQQLSQPNHVHLADQLGKSLDASENLLSTLMDVSALESGHVEPDIQPVNARDVIERIAAEVYPQAARKSLSLRMR